MGIWKSIKNRAIKGRLIDERLHDLAVQEIQAGRRREGLWAKAIVEAGPNEAQAKVEYLRLLVQRLRDEWYLAEQRGDQATQQPTSGTAESPVVPALCERRRFENIEAPKYNDILQCTGELRFQYLLRRWYSLKGNVYVLEGNVPGSIIQELQKYFTRYGV